MAVVVVVHCASNHYRRYSCLSGAAAADRHCTTVRLYNGYVERDDARSELICRQRSLSPTPWRSSLSLDSRSDVSGFFAPTPPPPSPVLVGIYKRPPTSFEDSQFAFADISRLINSHQQQHLQPATIANANANAGNVHANCLLFTNAELELELDHPLDHNFSLTLTHLFFLFCSPFPSLTLSVIVH